MSVTDRHFALSPEQRSHSSSSNAAPKVPAGQWRGQVLSLRQGPLALASAINGWGSTVLSDEGRNENSNRVDLIPLLRKEIHL